MRAGNKRRVSMIPLQGTALTSDLFIPSCKPGQGSLPLVGTHAFEVVCLHCIMGALRDMPHLAPQASSAWWWSSAAALLVLAMHLDQMFPVLCFFKSLESGARIWG
jgi:hypothetical protein